jgi:class 3 adenylate cyclase/tetratricopeptide (TPR) repeat protein
VICPTCSTENKPGRKFCSHCGAPLARACPACGAAAEPDDAFCGECGAALVETTTAPARPAPAAERRLVTVLFADLVGFTPLSESRDAEEVRELLSRYFDGCRRIVELYGGTVEKFIGDAVMAVWGTPTATEDDAERAVRAALDLVAAVSALGQELGAEELRARVGVLTGEAAVTLGAEGEGMVAGDIVNTASRVQSVAKPGSVLVGESTRRATDQTIVYEEAGSFELKGKTGLTPLWRARRVVSGLRGSLKSEGLEAPFVGRDRELRQLKDLFHASAEESKAHLVSVTGIAGIGKSRLVWEFYKYFDGIAELVWWHRGRCLPYGDGVTYWALADMVRMRCRIAEDDEPQAGLQKLRTALDEHILDAEERSFVQPRLGQLLGLTEHTSLDRDDLFAAARIFFERLAESYPTLLVFEDVQWADESLLDFIEYLLDWSRNHPLFVVTLARPELLERRPTWGAGQRNFTSIFLEPLPRPAMDELLGGLVPGLPEELRDRILERAEGIPLYAVETVRMLLDRGLLVQDQSAYRLTGAVEELEVPETLQALIAARLDGLSADERRLLQDGAVLGKTFTKQSLGALSGSPAEQVEELLAALVRKEVLSVQADPRSPEHGQYGFLQDLMRRVAYETLSKRDRRERHLTAASLLQSALAEEEIVEVVASHYVAAHEAAPDAEDADVVKAKAREALVRAGRHAESLAAPSEARRYFEQAAGFTDEPLERAELLALAGEMGGFAGAPEAARGPMEEAIAIYEAAGDTHAAARVLLKLSHFFAFTTRREESIARLESAFDLLSQEEPDEDLAMLAAQLARVYWFSGDTERAAERADLALDIAEEQGFVGPLVFALRGKSAVLHSKGHDQQSFALLKHGLSLAIEHELWEDARVCYFLLSDGCFQRDRYREALTYIDQSVSLARKFGHRPQEWSAISERTYALMMLGEWDEAYAMCRDLADEWIHSGGLMLSMLQVGVDIAIHRGELDAARSLQERFPHLEGSDDLQNRSCWLGATAALRRAEGRLDEALALASTAVFEAAPTFGPGHQGVKPPAVVALEAAIELGDTETTEKLFAFIEGIPPGLKPPYLEVQARRLRARIAGDAGGLEGAAHRFDELEIPFWRAVTLLEHAELTGDHESRAEALATFEHLRATPWIERATPVEVVA